MSGWPYTPDVNVLMNQTFNQLIQNSFHRPWKVFFADWVEWDRWAQVIECGCPALIVCHCGGVLGGTANLAEYDSNHCHQAWSDADPYVHRPATFCSFLQIKKLPAWCCAVAACSWWLFLRWPVVIDWSACPVADVAGGSTRGLPGALLLTSGGGLYLSVGQHGQRTSREGQLVTLPGDHNATAFLLAFFIVSRTDWPAAVETLPPVAAGWRPAGYTGN